MDDAVQSAAYGKVAKAAGWTGLGCSQVALKREKKPLSVYAHLQIYTPMHTTTFLGIRYR